jgi:hypothetical protein
VLGQAGAIAKKPPHAAGSGDITQVETAVAVTAVSTAAALVLASGVPMTGTWVTFVSDTDCFIHWGPNASIAAASSTASWPLVAGQQYEYFISEADQYFRVIRKTSDGTLKIHRSSQA